MEHTIATIFLPRSYCQTYIPKIPGFGVVFQQDGALAHRARDTVAFPERKVPNFVSPTLWSPNSPDLNPNNYSIWDVDLMQEKVYRSRIANVNELEMRLIDEWYRGRFYQSIVDAVIATSGAVVISACVRGAGHTLSTKHKVSAILSCTHGRRPGAEFGGDQTNFSRPNFRKNFHFQGKNF